MPSFDFETMTTESPPWLRRIGEEFSRSLGVAESPAQVSRVEMRVVRPSMSSPWGVALQPLIFPSLWLLIGCISAVDTYLTVKFRESLVFLESNPIANALLDLDQGDGSLLIGFKFLGSTLALGILAALYMQNRRRGIIVSSGIACFQVGLLYYLLAV